MKPLSVLQQTREVCATITISMAGTLSISGCVVPVPQMGPSATVHFQTFKHFMITLSMKFSSKVILQTATRWTEGTSKPNLNVVSA